MAEADEKTVKVARSRDAAVTVTISVKAPADSVDDIVAAVLKQIAGKWADDHVTPPDLGPLPPGA
jgi:hypothetical protein